MKIIKHIATIKEWKNVSIELNLIEWKEGKPQYDLRKWEGNTPLKGISLQKDDLISLYDAITAELAREKIDYMKRDDIILPFGIEEDEEDLPFSNVSRNAKNDEGEEKLPFGEVVCSNKSEEKERSDVETLDFRNVIVHDKFDECILEGHDYIDVEAIVPVYKLNGVTDVKIKARHCKTCGAYYISNFTYADLKKNGTILCKVVTKKEYNNFIKNTEFVNLDFQSILAIMGYTVNAQDNLSDSCRQAILDRAIHDGIYTKQKAINHISFLIKLNEDKANMSSAVSKWRRDREFLTGTKDRNTVKIAGIVK